MEYSVKKFNQLTTIELYQILQLRSEVFVVEQNCAYLDIDGNDNVSLHVIGKKYGMIVTYSRIFNKGDLHKQASFGRVVVKESERMYGYGHELIDESIKAINTNFGEQVINISAQKHLTKFYEAHDFKSEGEEYLEDGIPHIKMIRS